MDTAQEIKKRLDIADFISQYLQLKKVGINYSALCPFHDEKTPSFIVSPERQSFRCFGCGESGDVISFYQKIEGLSFTEALKLLGERTGVEVRFKSKEATDKERTVRDKIYSINLLCAKYFKIMLKDQIGKNAFLYLKKRKISDDAIDKYKIGFAPSGNRLRQILYRKKISENDLALAGHPERFRHRIIFPIFDTLGNIIGFSGRILENGLPQGISPHPKYLNTPETPVFHKSKILYGINIAKEFIRKKKRAVLVEGQMDVIAAYDAGVGEAVASSGTALTADHLKMIKRYSTNVIFAFDEDEAGQKAALSAVQLALHQMLDFKLTIIENYKDVGELVENEPKKLSEVIDLALPPVEWLVKRAGNNLGAKEKKELASKAMRFISAMQDEIEKAHYVNYIARALSVPEVTIERALMKIKNKQEDQEEKRMPVHDIELEFLSLIINHPKIIGDLTLEEDIQFENNAYAGIYKKARLCYDDQSKCEALLRKLKKSLDREIIEKIEASTISWDNKIAEDEGEAFQEFLSIKKILTNKKREKIKHNYAKLIAEAESGGKIEKVRELMAKLQQELK